MMKPITVGSSEYIIRTYKISNIFFFFQPHVYLAYEQLNTSKGPNHVIHVLW